MTDDDLSRDLERIASWGDPGEVPPVDELADRPVGLAPPTRRHRPRAAWLLAAAAVLAAVAVVGAIGLLGGDDQATTAGVPNPDECAVDDGPGSVTAVDPATGEELWSRSVSGMPVMRVVGDVVVVAAMNTDVGVPISETLTAFDATSGEPLWCRTETGMPESTLTTATDVLLLYEDRVDAVAAPTGEVTWSTQLDRPFSATGGQDNLIDGRLYLSDDTAEVSGSRWIVLDVTDGRVVEELTVQEGEAPPAPRSATDTPAWQATLPGRPWVVGDLLVMIEAADDTAGITAYGLADGEARWTAEVPGPAPILARAGDVVAVQTGTVLTALDSSSGEVVWQSEDGIADLAPGGHVWLAATGDGATLVSLVYSPPPNPDGDPVVTTDDDAPATLERAWVRIADPPFAPRKGGIHVWTGEELLVAGGNTLVECPSGSSCPVSDYAVLDGAAYDPDTDSWRPIADLPVTIQVALYSAALDDDVYVTAITDRIQLLHYSISEDRWEVSDVSDQGRSLVVAMDDRVVLARLADAGTDIGGPAGSAEPDVLLDPSTGGERPLPTDPLAPAGWRSMVWDGEYLYLFAAQRVGDVPDSGVARFDPDTWEWELLDGLGAPFSTEQGATWLVEGDLLVPTPRDGEFQAYDTAREEWVDLPPVELREGAGAVSGVIGSDGVVFDWYHSGAPADQDHVLYDLVSGTIIEVPGTDSLAADQSTFAGTAMGPDLLVLYYVPAADGGSVAATGGWMLTTVEPGEE